MMKQPVRTSISDFIKTTMGSQFVIPVYQRVYTWSPEKETARYMSDLADLLEHRSENHFLGIIIYLESEVSAMFRQLQIVDGQQRMTTSFLFLLALKKFAEEKKDLHTAGMIEDYYLYNRHADEKGSLRLKPAVSSDDVFARLVYGDVRDLSRKEKESGVYRNYEYIYRSIKELSKKHSLLEILDTLSRLDILEFPLSPSDDAQQIFESINSTGAPLTSADLIRNYVLMNHQDAEQERYYRMYWQPLEEMIPESRKLEEFFRYYLAAKTYDLLNRRDVYEGFKKFWNRDERSAEDKLREINRYCHYYFYLYAGPASDAEIEKAASDFRISDYRTPAPFLMEMYSLFADGKINAYEMHALIRLIDSYLMRRALCGNDTSALSRYFPTLLRSVLSARKKDPKQDIVTLAKVNLITFNKGRSLAMPTDDQLRAQLREINAYSLMCIRTVLERIEHHDATARVDVSALNIEHIMPQHPNRWWKNESGTADQDEYTFYANLIGNLTLASEYDNTRMGNEDFAYKKQILSKTLHIRLNTEILKLRRWNKDEILKRCDRIADKIIAIYPYNGANNDRTSVSYSIAEEDNFVLNAPTVSARAIMHGEEDVEVLAGTTMKPYGENEMRRMHDLFRKMDESGVFHEIDGGRVQFTQSWHFASLNDAAQFLMHRGGDNTASWKKENTEVLWKDTQEETLKETDKKMENTNEKKTHEKREGNRTKKNQKPETKKAENPKQTADAAKKEQPAKKKTKRKPAKSADSKKSETKTEETKKKQVKQNTPKTEETKQTAEGETKKKRSRRRRKPAKKNQEAAVTAENKQEKTVSATVADASSEAPAKKKRRRRRSKKSSNAQQTDAAVKTEKQTKSEKPAKKEQSKAKSSNQKKNQPKQNGKKANGTAKTEKKPAGKQAGNKNKGNGKRNSRGRNPRNPMGIVPQKNTSVTAQSAVGVPFVRFAGMDQNNH